MCDCADNRDLQTNNDGQVPEHCLHCGERQPFRRNLCRKCFDDVDIRHAYPTLPRHGEHSGRWKGGISTDNTGRTCVKQPEHPKADVRGYVNVKYLAFESLIGRALCPDELVLQLDGDASNIEPENLRIHFRNKGYALIRYQSLDENIAHHEEARARLEDWTAELPEERRKLADMLRAKVQRLTE